MILKLAFDFLIVYYLLDFNRSFIIGKGFTVIGYPLKWNIKDIILIGFQAIWCFQNLICSQTFELMDMCEFILKLNSFGCGHGSGRTISRFPPSFFLYTSEGFEIEA